MRIALIGDFKLDSLRHVQTVVRKLHKGLLRGGHDVLPVSFRDLMLQHSILPGKRLARRLAKPRTDRFCCDLLKDYAPDLVIVMAFKNLDDDSIALWQRELPGVPWAAWYEDPLDGIRESYRKIFARMNWLLATGGGPRLAVLARDCSVKAAFIPNPCDPDIEMNYQVPDNHRCDMIFTGKLGHSKCGTDDMRGELIRTLVEKYGMVTFGSLGRPVVFGLDYYRRISGARIALSINVSNDIPKYHSDRLINYLACGTFTLARQVPESNLLFQDRQHLRYFDSVEQCLQLADYYLQNQTEREAIAAAGIAHAHEYFHPGRIARALLDIAIEETCNEPWAEIHIPNQSLA